MEHSSQNVCLPLPVTVTSRITTYEQREQYLLNFLKNVLPSCDIKGIDDELKKSFTFNKHKNKVAKKKPQKSPFLTIRKSILLGLNKFGKKSLRYADMLPLNSLWLEYMHHMLGIEDFTSLPTNSTNPHWENISQRLMKADYHGAKVTITRSKCPSTVGIKGLIIQDTKNTFRLLSEDDVIRTIPKVSCVFHVHLDENVHIEVFGKELCVRPAERSVKKFKNLHIPEL
ncbi:ribonuclease P protein subunit p29 isoform X2 [Nasonia vitripennis]|uniref:Ribonuclease P protein subunit p29 n=1 Tax=Nasonia vitripennis TaxID=7425 RepID=A0A7M7G7T5_NASVI|nr:ribonuclease P protein subunit p29 isoform X2 [Nasonia vitripennis]